MHRNAVFVDIENLLKGCSASGDLVDLMVELVALTRPPRSRLTVAMSHHFMGQIGHELHRRIPGARIVVGSGPDGADLALIDAMADSNLCAGDRVVLASGDGIFADPVAKLAARGIDTTVVAHRGDLSRRLHMASTHRVYVDQLADVPQTHKAA